MRGAPLFLFAAVATAVLAVAAAVAAEGPAGAPEGPAQDDEEMGGETLGDEALEAETRESETQQTLEALGYVDTAVTGNPRERGVTAMLPGAFDGLNLYSSRNLASAVLMDMEGRVVHRWETLDPAEKADKDISWMHVEMQPNGDLLVIAKDHYAARVDWDSKVIWKRKMRAHHDLEVGRRGGVYVLTRGVRMHPIGDVDAPVLEDHISLLAGDGVPRRRTALFPLLRFAIPRARFTTLVKKVIAGVPISELRMPEAEGDLVHTNSIQVLPRAIPGVAPVGSILLSAREINRIVILDPTAKKVLWAWGEGWLQGQHHATLLDNGHILVFDNGVQRERSRVLEIDPARRRVVWSYTNDELFTQFRGAAQRLPNGNTLITESDSGHVIEVTNEKNKVWEFWNPDVDDTDPKKPERAAIYRMHRYPRDYLQRAL